MIDRDVARKLTQEELEKYKGPAHHISNHEVLRPDSKSTPVRLSLTAVLIAWIMY